MQEVGRLLTRFFQHLFLLGLDIAHLLLILGNSLFQYFLFLPNRLPFLLPISFVARDVLQLLVIIDMFLAHQVRRITDDGFTQADLAGYLNGKTATGLTDR